MAYHERVCEVEHVGFNSVQKGPQDGRGHPVELWVRYKVLFQRRLGITEQERVYLIAEVLWEVRGRGIRSLVAVP